MCVLLKPSYKSYIWGGDTLRRVYGKSTPHDVTAESWELSTHPDGTCLIDGTDEPFVHYLARLGKAAIGSNCTQLGNTIDEIARAFPLLIKLIDAKSDLSIQVHPDDAYAAQFGSLGKTEMWYVLAAEPGAGIYCGFDAPVDPDTLRRAIEGGTVTDLLRFIPCKAGDAYLIPAGTLHAIRAGLLIAEVQQNSNITYRVYDYDRLGTDGLPRELHKAQALEVADLRSVIPPYAPQPPVQCDGYATRRISECTYFTCDAVTLDGTMLYATTTRSFAALLVTRGSLTLRHGDVVLHAPTLSTLFIPAATHGVTIQGDADLLIATI